MTSTALVVSERGQDLTFTFEDLLRYHGPGSPGGVALAFKALERALPLVYPDGPAPRRELTVRTSFGGPGARDAFEMALRVVSDGRYVVDSALARPDRGRVLEDFVFCVGCGERTVTLLLREGFVTEEFIDVVRIPDRDDTEKALLARLKLELAGRVMGASADEVYELAATSEPPPAAA